MNSNTIRTARFAHFPEVWNAALAVLESAGFGLGMWLALSVLARAAEAPFFVVTGGPETPILAGALFLVGRIWVGSNSLAVPWTPRVVESIVLGIIVGLVGRGAGWGYGLIAAYVPLPDALALGFLRGVWRAAALVAPYAFASDRPTRRRARQERSD
jgi:hypothetical protein